MSKSSHDGELVGELVLGPCLSRPFLCSPYVESAGSFRPADRVDRCPRGEEGESCQITLQGFRARKTGPEIPLQKATCATHGGFTIYPLGHVPYGRVRVAPVDLSGRPLQDGGPTASTSWRGCLPGSSARCRGRPEVAR